MMANQNYSEITANLLNFTSISGIKCSNHQPRTTTPGTVAYYVGVYFLPAIFAVGILGNVLNLIVLNSKGMRTKTNCFLSAMAATDLCFFFVMVLFNLSAFDALATSDTFLKFHTDAKMTLTAMANWFSAASIWIAVAVTVERLMAICRPLHARLFWKTRHVVLLLLSIYIFSFYLFLHTWFWMWPTSKPLCNGHGRRVYGLKLINNTDSPILYDYVIVSKYIAITFTIVVPVFVLMFLNSLLLYYLRRNRRDMVAKLVPADVALSNSNFPPNNKKNSTSSTAAISITMRQRTCENKVAFMVSVIIVSFIVCISPSAFMFLFETIGMMVLKYPKPRWFTTLVTISNQLVTINKSMNFVLYCSAGKHFRRKLVQLIAKRLHFKRCYRTTIVNGSRSVSRADNYTLNSFPQTVETSSPAQFNTSIRSVLSSTSSRNRSLDQQMSPGFLMNTRNVEEAENRFKFNNNESWRKLSPQRGYVKQKNGSATPSPKQQIQQQQRAKACGRMINNGVAIKTKKEKELDWLLNKDEEK